jgi:hypothetical protein
MLLIALRSVGSCRNSLRSSGQSFYQQPFSSVDCSSPMDCSVSFSCAVSNVVRYPGFTDKKRLLASIRCTAGGEASFVEWMIPWLRGYRNDVVVLDRYPTSILGLARPRIRICGFRGSLWRTVFKSILNSHGLLLHHSTTDWLAILCLKFSHTHKTLSVFSDVGFTTTCTRNLRIVWSTDLERYP